MEQKARTPRVIERKYGSVIRTNVEILTHQWHRLEGCSKKYKLSKNDIIAQALQLWFNSVDGGGEQ